MSPDNTYYEKTFNKKELRIKNIEVKHYEIIKMIVSNECRKIDGNILVEHQ